MAKTADAQIDFGKAKIGNILLKSTPPVMFALLIQALYNIVDSFFVGRYSGDALTALTVVYPLQLVIIALAVGTGVGVNTYMARKYAQGREDEARKTAGTGILLALISWAIFAVVSLLIMRPYAAISATSPAAIDDAVSYGNIVCAGSLFTFLEGTFSKVHQARGNMRVPMIAQVVGAVINIIFDPILISGFTFIPAMGVAGAAVATVAGQFASAIITGVKGFHLPPKKNLGKYVKKIYYYGYSSILMQLLYTFYIVLLNMILAGFSDAAVTVLGLYYKMQSFFFIPLLGLQTCVVPILSFNYTCKYYGRCKRLMTDSIVISAIFMVLGVACFTFIPEYLIRIFSQSEEVISIGKTAFPIIAASFLPAAASFMMPVFFQSIGDGKKSAFLSCLRQVFCLVPIFWAFSKIGLDYAWLSFPVSELISVAAGYAMYRATLKKWGVAGKAAADSVASGAFAKDGALPQADTRENTQNATGDDINENANEGARMIAEKK